MPIDKPVGPAIEPQVPAMPSFGDTDSADDHRHARPACREATGDVGMKQKRLHDIGPRPAKMPSQSEQHARIPAPPGVQRRDPNAGIAKHTGQFSLAGQANHLGLEPVAIEICHQLNELTFRSAGIEFRNDESDANAASGWRSFGIGGGMTHEKTPKLFRTSATRKVDHQDRDN